MPDQQHVFYRGTDDHIHHIYWDASSGKLFADDWTARTRAPLAAGNPAAMATPGQQHVFYRGQDSQIHHILWVAEKRRLFRDVWTQGAGVPPALGDPVTMESPGQQHVFYRGPGGSVCHVFWDASANRLFRDDWTVNAGAPPAAGDPATLATPGQQHVFYRGERGGVQHILWNASTGRFGHDDWTSGTHGVPMPAGNVATMETGGQQHVFYRGTDGSIRHILWSPLTGALHRDDWTARAPGAPPAVGDPALLLTDEGQQHVFYRGAGGKINHIFWDPSSPSSPQLGFDEWTSVAPGAPAGGDPATLLFAGQQHVFYPGPGGAVDHILWDPSSRRRWFDDWTSRAGAPMAAGTPATLVTSDSPSEHTWSILPLGDSMTEGFPPELQGAYRVRLFATATHWGKRIQFVGSQPNGPTDPVEGASFPRNHEGHSGYYIDQIAAIVSEAVRPQPDVVLLMIGANDMLDLLNHGHVAEAPDRLAKLVDRILASNLDALVVVARIPPLPAKAAEVIAYNEGVAAVVRRFADAGERVLLADMHSNFPQWLLSGDNIHPARAGYEHIAAVWYAAIDAFLT